MKLERDNSLEENIDILSLIGFKYAQKFEEETHSSLTSLIDKLIELRKIQNKELPPLHLLLPINQERFEDICRVMNSLYLEDEEKEEIDYAINTLSTSYGYDVPIKITSE